jgi:hypothetical protein
MRGIKTFSKFFDPLLGVEELRFCSNSTIRPMILRFKQ